MSSFSAILACHSAGKPLSTSEAVKCISDEEIFVCWRIPVVAAHRAILKTLERHIWAVSCLCCCRTDFGKPANETEIWAKVVTFLGANPTDAGNAGGIFHRLSCANPISPVIAVGRCCRKSRNSSDGISHRHSPHQRSEEHTSELQSHLNLVFP